MHRPYFTFSYLPRPSLSEQLPVVIGFLAFWALVI